MTNVSGRTSSSHRSRIIQSPTDRSSVNISDTLSYSGFRLKLIAVIASEPVTVERTTLLEAGPLCQVIQFILRLGRPAGYDGYDVDGRGFSDFQDGTVSSVRYYAVPQPGLYAAVGKFDVSTCFRMIVLSQHCCSI